MLFQAWLRELGAAPKTKGHTKAVMYRLFEKAMLWDMVEWQRNLMELVEIKGVTKRQKRPIILTVEQYDQILELLPEPDRTMVVVAQCTGLRAESFWCSMGRHRLRDPEHESHPSGRSQPHQDGKDRSLGGRTAARSELRGEPSDLEAEVGS